MRKKILTMFAMLVGLAVPTMAATATPDSVFVVKNGLIVSAYEVGKDVDNITFQKKAQLDGNTVQVGDKTVEMRSAVMMESGGYTSVYFSSVAGCKTVADIQKGGKALQVTLSPNLLGKNVMFSSFDTDYNADTDYFQITYIDFDEYNASDSYEPVNVSAYDWNETVADGSLRLCVNDGTADLRFDCEMLDGGDTFAGQYNGGYVEIKQSNDYFTVDGERKDLRAVFAEKKVDGINFYLTPGNIDNANDLENCYYYVRLFVPTRNMDGRELDVQGNQEYELTFVDNVTDLNNPLTINVSSDNPGNATGTISVLAGDDGTYTIKIDVEKLGNSADRSLSVAYTEGTPMEYTLALPSQYTVAGGEATSLKSAVITHNTADALYTVYLSSKEGVATVQGIADADVVITVPEAFFNDDALHGFSGGDNNAKVSVSYGGTTYRQANTGSATDAVAIGGNAKVSVADGKANIDFTVFGIKKFKGALQGHYEGSITQL